MSDWRIDNDMNMYLKGLEDGKDRNKQEIEKLEQQLQQKENIIKEVREYIQIDDKIIYADDILEILDKENKDESNKN